MFKSFSLKTEVNEKDFDLILIEFDVYFIRQESITHERVKFHRRVQKSVFIRGLYEWAGYCEFPDKKY